MCPLHDVVVCFCGWLLFLVCCLLVWAFVCSSGGVWLFCCWVGWLFGVVVVLVIVVLVCLCVRLFVCRVVVFVCILCVLCVVWLVVRVLCCEEWLVLWLFVL